MTRCALIVRRWGYVLALALMGACASLVAFALGVSLLQAFLNWSPWVVGVGCLAGCGCVLQGARAVRPDESIEGAAQGRFLRYAKSCGDRLCAYLGLKHFFSYPPVWVAGCFGAALLLAAFGSFPSLRVVLRVSDDWSLGLRWLALSYVLAPVTIAGACVRGYLLFRRTAPDAPSPGGTKRAADRSVTFASWDELRSWLRNDDPVTQSQDDAFGYTGIARRIAKRLLETPIPAQVVVGALGAGKTSLRCLVQAELGAKATTHVLAVELWSYDTPQAAVEGVLRTLLQGVARETTVLSARGLPENYVAAMTAAGGIASNLASLANRPRSPFDVLNAIDRIALTIGHRFVVWVEDLERFAHASHDGELLEHSERLAPLRALLYGLSQLKAVSVVTATVALHARFDTEKIARYVEELPPIEFADAARILKEFRKGCLSLSPFIDPAAPEARKGWETLGSPEDEERRAVLGGALRSLPDVVSSLCRTPRTLKQALRRVHTVWNAMAGEIDFDDLLAMHLVKETEPDVFAVVHAHWQGFTRDQSVSDYDKAATEAGERALSALQLQGDRATAVNVILKKVLSSTAQKTKPQGLSIRRYWQRFLAEPEIAAEDRDQHVLRVLDGNDDEALLCLLEGAQSGIVEHFGQWILPERLPRLLLGLVSRRVGEDPSDWFKSGEWPGGAAPGLIPLWRMMRRARESGGLVLSAIAEVLAQSFELAITNLNLVFELEHNFAGPRDTKTILGLQESVEGQSLAEAARQHLWALLVRTYGDNPAALIAALRGTPKWTLARVIWGSNRIDRKDFSSLPFAEWSRLATTILAACDQAPELMLPQLAALVTRESGDRLDGDRLVTTYEFDSGRARLLFGNEHEVLRRFRGEVQVLDDTRKVMEPVIAAANAMNENDAQGGAS